MVRDGNRWLFYCGSADQKTIGVATAPCTKHHLGGRADFWNDLVKSPDRPTCGYWSRRGWNQSRGRSGECRRRNSRTKQNSDLTLNGLAAVSTAIRGYSLTRLRRIKSQEAGD